MSSSLRSVMYIVAADLSVPHTQSTKIAREGAVKDKLDRCLSDLCSRWQQCHHGMNAITETISLFITDLVAYSLAPGGESLWLWRTVSCIL